MVARISVSSPERVPLIGQDRLEATSRKTVGPIQEGEREQKAAADDSPANGLHQLTGGSRRSSGREDVIDYEHIRTIRARIDVDFQRVRAVLQLVCDPSRRERKLADFSDRDDPGTERLRHWPAEQKSSALDRGNERYAGIRERSCHALAGLRKQGAVREQRRNVLEKDTRLREIRDVSNGATEVVRFSSR